MTSILRVDDFRCHDECLVKVLPGRECEAAEFAVSLSESGYKIGLYIEGSEITNWNFLRKASGIGRFEFVNFSRTLKLASLESIPNATFLRVVGQKLQIDFSVFKNLETLYYQWSGESTGLELLDHLKDVHLFEIGSQANARPLPLPASVVRLSIFNYQHHSLSFLKRMSRLKQLTIKRARNVSKLPLIDGLSKLELKNVGRDDFDYATVPLTCKDVVIDSCAPVTSWDFVERASNLKKLVILKTKIPAISSGVSVALEKIDVVDLYRTSLPVRNVVGIGNDMKRTE